MEIQDAVIVSGARTPVGRFGGAFKDIAAPDLGAEAIKAALERASISPRTGRRGRDGQCVAGDRSRIRRAIGLR